MFKKRYNRGMKKLNISNIIAIEKDPIATDRTSDRSELIPAKAEADTNNYSNKLLANNLSSKQQKPYILFGIGATLFIAIALATAFNFN